MKYPHHIYVLNLLNTVPATCTVSEGNAAWDHMFGYIHTHFPVPSSCIVDGKWPELTLDMKNAALDCQKLITMPRDVFEADLESLPPYFSDVLFPVAVARYLLRECRLNMSHCDTQTFTEFHKRYGVLILSY